MSLIDSDLRRTWLFGPGADAHAHDAMQRSGADVLIVDLEDFTPPARRGLPSLLERWRDAGRIVAAARASAPRSSAPKTWPPRTTALLQTLAHANANGAFAVSS